MYHRNEKLTVPSRYWNIVGYT